MISWLDKGIKTMDALRIHEANWESKRLKELMTVSPNQQKGYTLTAKSMQPLAISRGSKKT